MQTKTRLSLLSLISTLVLLANLVVPVTVFADDETPPPAATEEPALPPQDESTPDTPASDQEEASVSEILEELPPETDIVVLNEEGEVLPLVSEEAAAIIEEG